MSGALATRTVAKPWGKDVLPAPFHAPVGERIGEIWFEPPAELPQLLVKYIFTSEKLSVQVHPSDAQSPGHGKEECWLILDAEPGASLGIGFREPLSPNTMRAAAIDGSIERLMQWHSVRRGDFFYIPAGIVHAIGPGVSLIEVQQNSDTTYRLYDYGRPRQLHLDDAIGVARGERYPADLRKTVGAGGEATLVDGPHFRLDQIEGPPSADMAAHYADGPLLVIPREGPVHVGGAELVAGQCGLARSISDVEAARYAVALLARPLNG